MSAMYHTAQEAFLRFGYTEMKDLLKAFITLISATLLVSITLADKIGGYAGAPKASKMALLTSWIGLILSLIAAGLSMCSAAVAGVIAAQPLRNSVDPAASQASSLSILCAIGSGALYVGALICMSYAAYRVMMNDEPPKQWDQL